ncbi:hypothetical protein PHYSODRAFT_472035 [Phytophthora sojae]|uniref:Uncharacterized protein n=1 Tax=Phytophthora sojae (strain P6497) TaxID=1094619 RepID=G4YQ70_PHYSP|nr:hypothetical protein PHYSODRAFT_472035 [Phytophthora sojae]EGZ29574.1 hypothetical protein PHYSODRAFT_472035 [Phytophthora sojae]|eukprot:XP_009516849.1 hypothetical protein PHYSODRAFT_472035 [Phytophthora sojae]
MLSVPITANKSFLIKLISSLLTKAKTAMETSSLMIFCRSNLYLLTLYCRILTDTSPMYLNISVSSIIGSSFTKQRTSSVRLSATDTDTGMCSFVKTVFSPC